MTMPRTAVVEARTRVHYLASPLITPTNPITVALIGAGGTGSRVLTGLLNIHVALIALGGPGLHVTLWDNDVITEANLGRQLFAPAEVGLPKAVALINRVNRFSGTNWKARNAFFDRTTVKTGFDLANIVISCVDNVPARREIAAILKESRKLALHQRSPFYWMDFGNAQHIGQVILATVQKMKQPTSKEFKTVAELPFVTDEYGEVMDESAEEDNTPSCSLAEALEKQDLFINPCLADMGCALLWHLLRYHRIDNRGCFMNLADLRTQPLKV